MKNKKNQNTIVPLPNDPERNIPTKPDQNPDPSRKPEINDPTRIKEPNRADPTRIDEPPSQGPKKNK